MPTRESYLMIDHRASPGLPEDIARAMGLDPALCKEGKLFEAASLTCAHCKTAVVKNPLRERERAKCLQCDHYICDICANEARLPGYVHSPWDKKIDDGLNARERQRLSYASAPPLTLLGIAPPEHPAAKLILP